MKQTNKPAATEEGRKEKVRQVLRAAGEPLDPIQIAERIGETWCMWNGSGFGSAVKPVLRKIGAKSHKGKYSLAAAPVLDREMRFETISLPNTDAGLLESMRVEVVSLDSPGVSGATLDDLCDAFAVPRPVSFEPGHLMSWEKYRELERLQQK